MFPLKEFFDQVQQTPVNRKNDLADVSGLVNNVVFNKSLLRQKLSNLDSLSDTEISNLIRNSIDTICEDIMNQDSFYISLIQNYRFLDIFCKVVNTIPIDYKKRLCCNKLTYDYFTLADRGDENIKYKFLNLSKTVNETNIKRLVSLGLDIETANNLAMSRYSSTSEIVNAKRLNFVICNKDPEIMTEQMIIYIYEKLFTRVGSLFEATMFDYYSDEEADELGRSFMTIYSAISLAILTIVNNLTSADIKKILVSYSSTWFYKGRPPIRFSLRSLSEDFSRVSYMVQLLEMDGVYLP